MVHQQQLLDGAVTPAPPRKAAAAATDAQPPPAARPATDKDGPPSSQNNFSEDFSEWAVGDRYELLRMLGRGSYGEVAQARDLSLPDKPFVAIKRISSPFDQEVDAVRLFREMHILRKIRGHDCVIQLLDVVQPPTDDLDDFHDLYMVFECKLSLIHI